MSDMTIQTAIHCMKAMICEAVCEECDYYGKTGTDHCEADAVRMAIEALSCSEKPNRSEPLTDKEQRIFLAAMGRERKVCKQVDDECCREPYEDSLVYICNEIERKVKGVLWTTV